VFFLQPLSTFTLSETIRFPVQGYRVLSYILCSGDRVSMFPWDSNVTMRVQSAVDAGIFHLLPQLHRRQTIPALPAVRERNFGIHDAEIPLKRSLLTHLDDPVRAMGSFVSLTWRGPARSTPRDA